jgi:DNA processing protein
MIREQNTLFYKNSSPAGEIEKDPLSTIALLGVAGVGSIFFRLLINAFGSPAVVLKANTNALESVPGIGSQTAQAIVNTEIDEFCEKTYQRLIDCGAQIVSIWSETYPHNLKEIHDPPALIFVRGELPAQDEMCIALVGTRAPNAYGLQQAHRIAEDLGSRGIATVSGMARGIDASAHDGSLQGNGRTFAVFGCGIDFIYPAENKSLAHKIESSGGLISEFVPGTQPDPGFFPRRNRIISGLSAGVLVVQGDEKSGALITAKLAIDQNREVFALPGGIDDRRSRGPHNLIRQGATLVTSADDILEGLGVGTKGENSPRIEKHRPALTPSEEIVAQRLTSEPVHIDKLVQELQQPVATVLTDLLGLELKGWVVQLPGKLFALKQ